MTCSQAKDRQTFTHNKQKIIIELVSVSINYYRIPFKTNSVFNQLISERSQLNNSALSN